MRAGILAVGTELLGSDRLDTNSLALTAALRSYGYRLRRKSVVPDVEEEIAAELERLTAELDLVVVTGGLGPTTDDLTREAASRAFGRKLIRDPHLEKEIREKVLRWTRRMPASNARQADLLEGAVSLRNPRGTAPGMRIDLDGATVFLLPGVPRELRYLIDAELVPWLAAHSEGTVVETRVLRVACIAESALEDLLAPAYEEFGKTEISLLASPGDIQVRLTVEGDGPMRRQRLTALSGRIEQLVGSSLYGVGAELTLEAVVGELLVQHGMTVVTAESCTAGLVAERLTRVAGSSAYFLGGVVAYANQLKCELLGVSAGSLATHGAVSREVVIEMATGAAERLGGDLGLATSGIAGPSGGTPEKPVGTVHIAVTGRGRQPVHRELRLPGDRNRVRWLASQWALDLLRRLFIQ